MNRYYVEITCQVLGLPDEELEVVFDAVADEVAELTDVIDADLGTRGWLFDFSMAVDAGDEPEALGRALAAVRSAVHAAGGSTEGWERHFEAIKQTVRSEAALTA